MASQIPAEDCASYEISFFMRGYHVYKDLWNTHTGQVLKLAKEPENSHDTYAVAVVKTCGAVVGRIPYNLVPLFSQFLAREFNKGVVEVTGERVNRGAGYRLEITCIYRLYGPKRFVECLEVKAKGLQERGLLPSS